MKKVVVGIVPTSKLFETNSPYDDHYKFINLYPKRVLECGGIPIGILLNDGNLDYSSLDLCDAFIIPGGNKVNKYVYEIIYYAIRHNKPVLGVCLGAQAIAIFSAIYENMDKDREYRVDEIIEIYKSLKEQYEGTLLKKLDDNNYHANLDFNKDRIEESKHKIDITEDSILYNVLNEKSINVLSLHGYDFKHVGSDFKVSAYAPDGVCEAIEYNNKDYFILGVHFHPEIDESNKIYASLIREAEKRQS